MSCNYDEGNPMLLTLQHYEASDHLYAPGAIIDLTDAAITIQGDGDPSPARSRTTWTSRTSRSATP